MKHRYRMTLDYDGRYFHGWQRQPNGRTVQEEIETALSKIAKQEVKLTGCGRTDTGVHAQNYVAHFDLYTEIPSNIHYKLNRMCDDDLSIKSVSLATRPDFHARYDAVERKYLYFIHGNKDPFQRYYSLYFHRFHELDWSSIQSLSELLMEYTHFYPFCKSNSGLKNYACKGLDMNWKIDHTKQVAVLDIRAHRFLRGMVRLIVGTSLKIGLKQMKLEHVAKAMKTQDRINGIYSCEPHGLHLAHVRYPE